MLRNLKMRFAYDVIGNKEKAVAILPQKIGISDKKAAKEILSRHKSVKSVLKKLGGRKADYRIFECKLIAGDPNTEVVHKEYGYMIKLDPKVVYFSPREAEERRRIAELVKPKERILIMFSGIAPFALAIKKRQPDCEIVCIDVNLQAIKYAMENVRLNRMQGIRNFCLNARNAEDFGVFDRIVMPLPENSLHYLDTAFACTRRGSIIHLYAISREDYKDVERRIEEVARDVNIRYKILNKKRVLPFAPRVDKVRIDIQAL